MAADRKVQKLLAEIEADLLQAFPLAAKSANVTEPVYALFLCYIDTTTDDYLPYVVVAPERVRRWAIERKGNDASWKIWSPEQELSGPLIKQKWLQEASLKAKIHACYELLCQSNGGDDDVRLKPFREMMWRVARLLNERNWEGLIDTTVDFVVVASDWSGSWTYEDIVNSLPPNKRNLLEERRLLFHQETDEERAEFQRQLDVAEANLASKTASERLAFWVDELTCLSTGQRCLLRERGWNESVALNRLAAIGGAACLPLLDLAVRLDAMPRDANGLPSTSAAILPAVFSTVEDIGRADSLIEIRLRAMLGTTCEFNRGRDTWNRTPFLIASCLRKLFDYPWPSTSYEGVLTDADKYLTAPLRTQPSS